MPWLIGEPSTPEAERRIATLCETHDGFRIGEEDLRLRGPGEILGTEQSGETDFRAADPLRDAELLAQARIDAEAALAADPRLTLPGHRFLRARLISDYQKVWTWIDLA